MLVGTSEFDVYYYSIMFSFRFASCSTAEFNCSLLIGTPAIYLCFRLEIGMFHVHCSRRRLSDSHPGWAY